MLLVALTFLSGCSSPARETPTASPVDKLGWRTFTQGPAVAPPPGEPISAISWTRDAEWELVNVWASTCIPCKREIPALNEALKIEGLQVLGVSRDQFKKYAKEFEQEVGAEFPSWQDPDGDYANTFHDYVNTNFIPFSVLARNGQLHAVHLGPLSSAGDIEEYIHSQTGTREN